MNTLWIVAKGTVQFATARAVLLTTLDSLVEKIDRKNFEWKEFMK